MIENSEQLIATSLPDRLAKQYRQFPRVFSDGGYFLGMDLSAPTLRSSLIENLSYGLLLSSAGNIIYPEGGTMLDFVLVVLPILPIIRRLVVYQPQKERR